MEYQEWLRVGSIIGPICILFLAGLALSLKSGLDKVQSPRKLRQLTENLSQTVLALTASLLGLAIIHRLVGLPVTVTW